MKAAKLRKLGSSSNANKNNFAKWDFEGTEECKKVYDRINKISNIKTLPLMPPAKWEEFCKKRKDGNI